MEKLDRGRFEVAPVFIDRQRRWHFADDPHGEGSWRERVQRGVRWEAGRGEPLPWRPDVAFIALHGVYGEDGQVQTILEELGVRYTGSRPEASRLALNKSLAKTVFRSAGLRVADDWEMSGNESPRQLAERIGAAHTGPWVVKPRDGGSSVGVHIVKTPNELLTALSANGDEPFLVEAYVAGLELTCGVLEQTPDRSPVALPPTEIVPLHQGFFDYVAKYTPGQSREITPARIPEDQTARIQAMSLTAHQRLGCSGYSRSDFILSPL